MNNKNDKNYDPFNLTDEELDNLLKQAMRDAGDTKFINYKGEEEDL